MNALGFIMTIGWRRLKMEKLPVIFRAERSGKFKGDVTAVFPTLPGCPGMMTCYEHVDQHSSCDIRWYRTTRRALPAEYKELYEEVKSIYDDVELVLRQRITAHMRELLKCWR